MPPAALPTGGEPTHATTDGLSQVWELLVEVDFVLVEVGANERIFGRFEREVER